MAKDILAEPNHETTSSVLRSTYTGNGSTTTYALPGPVANETSIIATINGVTQQDAAYSTDGSNIIFDAAPASGDAIEIRTLSAVAMSYAPMAGSVVTGIIADGAVTTGKIADSSITTAKIAAGAVVQADIGTNVAGTGPAFSARKDGTQAITQNTVTKITYDIEVFDTNNNFDSSRFTPTVAGYYQVNLTGSIETTSSDRYLQLHIYKNGTIIISAQPQYGSSTGANGMGAAISGLVYFNGSTDYIESYAVTNSTTTVLNGTFNNTFSACLVRAA
jgi:hypothetical protein